MTDKNKLDRLIDRLKNNKYISIGLFIGIILISIGTLTDSLTKISEYVKVVFEGPTLNEHELAIINKQLRPIYFGLLDEVIDENTNPDLRSTKLDSLGVIKLNEHINILKDITGNYTLFIEVFTNRISIYNNINLAETRAKNIADDMISKGIPSERIKTAISVSEKWEVSIDPKKERVEFKLYLLQLRK